VDYLNRVRNLSVETDRSTAITELKNLQSQVIKEDKDLKLVVETDKIKYPGFVNTTYFREIIYNAEHTIHHLALIRVALREMNLNIVGEDFGVAYATIQYRLSKINES